MLTRLLSLSLFLALLASSAPSIAQAPDSDTPKEPAEKQKAGEEEQPVVTHHTVRIGGRDVAYTATAGRMRLATEEGEPRADIFYIAYTKDGEEPGERPLTFSFNGGPGSSSVWLHLGVFGPMRVEMGDAGALLPPPHRVIDNEWSILDLTDLVFIDPVTTGFSRAAKGEDDSAFHGVESDVESVGEFVRLYTTRNGRWGSPKFLAGESYGTTRAANLAGRLQDRYGMYLNGVVLISAILNFQTARFDAGNDLPYVLFLPTYTATAWYHNRLSPDLQADLAAACREAEEFASDPYLRALFEGDDLSEADRARTVRTLARLTGLSEEHIVRTNMRIEIMRFTKELLRDQRKTVGRLDSRFTGVDRDAAGERFEEDPSYSAILGPYAGALNAYIRSDLGYESDLPYEILTGRVWPWSYSAHANRYLDVAQTLRAAITQNPSLRVFVGCGYYDLATPYFAAEYTFDHMGLEPEHRDLVEFAYYEAGHMMYVHQPSLEKLKADLASFYGRALQR